MFFHFSQRTNRCKACNQRLSGVLNNTNRSHELVDLIANIGADKDFVERLSTEDRNVFQKIYDEVKYLCRVATAGTEDARQLEKVKKTFEDAYQKAQKSPDLSVEAYVRITYLPG